MAQLGLTKELYFTTSTVIDWMDVFTRPAYKQIIVESLKYCQQQKGLEIYQRHPLFDGDFNDLDSNAFYCTELVWFIYRKELGIDLSQGRRHKKALFPPMIFCSDILTHPELKETYKF